MNAHQIARLQQNLDRHDLTDCERCGGHARIELRVLMLSVQAAPGMVGAVWEVSVACAMCTAYHSESEHPFERRVSLPQHSLPSHGSPLFLWERGRGLYVNPVFGGLFGAPDSELPTVPELLQHVSSGPGSDTLDSVRDMWSGNNRIAMKGNRHA